MREFVELSVFTKRWKELELNDDDLRFLQNIIVENPKVGDVIPGTNGIRKLRFAFGGKGTRGGVRIIYIDFKSVGRVYLLVAYPKSKQDDMTNKERQHFRKIVENLENSV